MAKSWGFINLFFTVIISLAIFFYFKSNEKKIVFIKIDKIYEDFQMKKELEGKFENIKKIRKNTLDSLELELKLISRRLNEGTKIGKDIINSFEEKKQNYLLKKKQFEEDNNAMAQQYTEQITKQLNQYVQNYGREKNYAYILGADGSGVIMHAEDVYDITNDMLKYVNMKYKGL